MAKSKPWKWLFLIGEFEVLFAICLSNAHQRRFLVYYFDITWQAKNVILQNIPNPSTKETNQEIAQKYRLTYHRLRA